MICQCRSTFWSRRFVMVHFYHNVPHKCISNVLLQTGSWPIQSCKSTPVIPQILSKGMLSFISFYSKKYSGRKLHWHHGLSTCDIKLNYLSKSYTVQTSVIMTSILNLFNNLESATFEEIRASTEIDAKDLQKYLQFLSSQNILSNVSVLIV